MMKYNNEIQQKKKSKGNALVNKRIRYWYQGKGKSCLNIIFLFLINISISCSLRLSPPILDSLYISFRSLSSFPPSPFFFYFPFSIIAVLMSKLASVIPSEPWIPKTTSTELGISSFSLKKKLGGEGVKEQKDK